MRKKIFFAIILSFILLVGLGLYSFYMDALKPDSQQTFILGRTMVSPESHSAIRLMVQNKATRTPVKDANVDVYLHSEKTGSIHLASGTTKEDGNANVSFKIPAVADGSYELQVKTSSAVGKDVEQIPIQVKKEYKILLTTDKPLYQPGQTIHIRSLTLRKWDLKPAQKNKMLFEVSDPKGNKVFKQTIDTSDFGIAACDFILASEVNEGAYRIKSKCENFTEEKEVNVKRYVLPKFKIEGQFDRGYYSPGQTVKAKLESRYFFGKPVSGAKVEVSVSTFDVEWNKRLSLEGTTDPEGIYSLEFELPSKLWGIPLLKGDAMVSVEIKVTDTASHSEKISRELTISNTPIHIVAIPETPNLIVNIPNTIYVCTTYPDGTPAVSDVTIGQETIQTSSLGIAEFKISYEKLQNNSLVIAARDAKGANANIQANLQYERSNDFFVVLDKPTYKAGDLINLKVLSARKNGNFYLDLIKDKQTILTQTLEMKNGKCESSIALPQDISGTLMVDVYRVNMGNYGYVASNAEIIEEVIEKPRPDWDGPKKQKRWANSENDFISRDTRLIFVAPVEDLMISASLDKETYRPGENAKIDFVVKDSKDQDKDSALSIAIVDESVFFLQEMQPGLEKVYFMLQQELLKPRYQIRYAPPVSYGEIVSMPGTQAKSGAKPGENQPRDEKEAREKKVILEEKQQATKVMFAMARVQAESHIAKDSYPDKVKQIQEMKRNYFRTLSTCLLSTPFFLVILSCLCIVVGFGYKMIKRKHEQYRN